MGASKLISKSISIVRSGTHSISGRKVRPLEMLGSTSAMTETVALELEKSELVNNIAYW